MAERPARITILTPSYNQAAYIERAIESVRAQDYPDVEHIVIDGGSYDGTIDILRKYKHLRWVSEEDRGQADALNKGLALATGEIIGWINSDDYYEENVFRPVASHFSDPATMWIVGNISYVDWAGTRLRMDRTPEISYRRLLSDADIVRQPSAFYRKSALDRAGGWSPAFFMTMDLDLWVRLAKLGAPKMVDENFACFRLHRDQKSGLGNLERQMFEICAIMRREHAPLRAVTRFCLRRQWLAARMAGRKALCAAGLAKPASGARP
jgi:glycosyltransferase involved in cell wall biosynthesis